MGSDPLVGPLQDNGGSTLTHALLSGSPAIDAGTNNGLILDQRGQPRTIHVQGSPGLPGSDGTDIGSLEMDPTLRCTGLLLFSNDVFVKFTSVSGKLYYLEYRTNVGAPGWASAQGSAAGSGGILTIIDSDAGSVPARFYRIRSQ